PRYLLEKVVVEGNKKTLRQVILRHVQIRNGEVFSADDPRLDRARYRLLSLGLFYDVQLYLERGSRRGWAVLKVRVKERNTIVVRDVVFGFSEITPYGALDVADRSFLGTGVDVSAAGVVSREQWGYRLRFSDLHFLESDFGLRCEGLFAHARDFFGTRNVIDEEGGDGTTSAYAEMWYDRAGGRLGTGYALRGDSFLTVDYRFEVINNTEVDPGTHLSYGERRPIEFGHLVPGHSTLSGTVFGVLHDTRDSSLLSSVGSRTAFQVELYSEVLGSEYEFSKFTLGHDHYFPLGRGHTIKLGLFAGLIMGDAPFFDQFFVGDFSAFVPSRVLELNFSHLHPSLLDTSVKEMRYEDLAASLGVEYSLPFFRGSGFVYGLDGFVGVGLFALASRQDLSHDPEGYSGYRVVPMDLTADLGIKLDTEIGLFVVSLANLFRLIPEWGDEATE
ncbi:MAG: BamA/TamA family outer membrane protein, partial [Deltaproteobacteria bacterium]|nr:BamA/TamA family outer membrane protein [Deltaproteobacteria bacterium]